MEELVSYTLGGRATPELISDSPAVAQYHKQG